MSAWRSFAAPNVVTSPYASRTALLATVATAEAPAEAAAWKVAILDGRALSSGYERYSVAAREKERQTRADLGSLAGMRCFLHKGSDTLISVTVAGLHNIYSAIT